MAYEPTDEQNALIAHDPATHARVLAGPGTGKSATLVAFIDRLAGEGGGQRVRLLTFTRAATAELAGKIADSDSIAIERPSTIHSFAISVLLRNEGTGNFPDPLRIADDWEQGNLVDAMLARLSGLNKKRVPKFRHELAAAWESLEPRPDPGHTANERKRFMSAWREHRQVFGYTMLGELPYALRDALRNHPDLEGIDYDLLVVDEYQDLNACDLEVLRLMAERGTTVVGAGDDDQSIYSFRRAHPVGIRQFLDDYPDAVHYPLSVTHRCGTTIVEWANAVIQGDLERPAERELLTPAPACPDGEVALLSFASEVSEAKGVADLVKHLIEDEEVPAEEILILARGDRYGLFTRPVMEALAEAEIPASDPDLPKQVLAERGNRRLFALLRLLHHKCDSLAWATLLDLAQGIGPSVTSYVYDRAKSEGRTFGEALLAAHEEAFPDAPQGSGAKTEELVSETLQWRDSVEVPDETPDEGWAQWIYDVAGETDLPPEPSDEFMGILFDLEEVIEPGQRLGQYLGQIAPLARDRAANRNEGVRVMTMTSSKGLTVRATIVIGVEEDVIPSPRATRSEETRLLYVAMTRARDFLFLTWARRRKGPAARAGRGKTRRARSTTSLLEGGPVTSQDGRTFINGRW